MFRLLFMIGIATALWPVDEKNRAVGLSADGSGIELSSTEVMSAAYSIFEDVSEFCERNSDVCLTGKRAIVSVSNSVQSHLSSQQMVAKPEETIEDTNG